MPRTATTTVTSSTIAQPVGSQTRSSILTRASQGLAKVFFTSEDLRNADKLYLVIHQLQTNVAAALRALVSNPTLGGNLVTGVIFTAGQTLYVQHGLGHAYRGFTCLRARGNPALLVEATLPTGVSANDRIPITSTNAGTYDLWIF